MVAVLHVAQPTSAGVARALLTLARAQAAGGDRVTVASPDGELRDLLAPHGIAWRRWRSDRQPGTTTPAEVRALRAILDASRPDVVHLHSSKAGLVGRLAVRGRIPTVFQPHAWSFLAARGALRAAAVRWERYATRWTHLTLFCSRQEQRQGEQHGIAGRGRVVLNGVDLSRFRACGAVEQAAARHGLALPGDAYVAAIVGRRCEQKGQDVAVRAWPAVRAAVGPAVLLLMGEGYEDFYDPDSGIMTCSPRSDVRPALLAADVVLLPSRWEGLSLSLLEAMATGRPVVATDVAGSAEALVEGALPGGGAVVAPDDPDGLAAAVIARFAEPGLARREAEAARRRAELTFAEAHTATSVRDAYRLLLGAA